MQLLKKLYDNFEEIVCTFFVGVMIFALTTQTVWRVFTGSSFAWTEELSRYSFIWAVFFAAALAVKRSAHVRITAQFMKASLKTRLFFRVISDLIWIGFNIFFVFVCWETIQEGLDFPEISPTLHVVKAKVEMILPASFLLTSFRIIEDYVRHYRAGTLLAMVKYEEQQ
ncbi:MAG: TRAP transporter small permease subunit [Desulfovibrio sp.]|nr:TRAP transporter small permease subunit [Desulfovibrio sp.]